MQSSPSYRQKLESCLSFVTINIRQFSSARHFTANLRLFETIFTWLNAILNSLHKLIHVCKFMCTCTADQMFILNFGLGQVMLLQFWRVNDHASTRSHTKLIEESVCTRLSHIRCTETFSQLEMLETFVRTVVNFQKTHCATGKRMHVGKNGFYKNKFPSIWHGPHTCKWSTKSNHWIQLLVWE